jgi:hypothetical protein
LRHCATNRGVAGSIADGVIGIFHWYNPSGRTMALGLTQPLTEKSTRNISWGKGVGLTNLPPSCADCLKNSRSLNLLETSGPAKACNMVALLYLYSLSVAYVAAVNRVCKDGDNFRKPNYTTSIK